MLNLFKIERNSPCECGSGRKYKRCCMGAVDELLSRWRREKIWPNLDLLRPLALACGLEADKDGYPLHPERIEKALALMAEAMAMGSEDQVVDEMMNYVHRLGALLDTGGELNAQLFPIHKLFAILNEMDAELMESSGEADINGLFDEFGARYLPTLVTQDALDDMAWSLIYCLRSRDWPDADLQSLIFGILCCLDNRFGNNPLWQLVFTVSIRDAASAIGDMKKLLDEDAVLDADQFDKYVEKHPLMVRDWSRQLELEVMPAIHAIVEKQIPLQVPPYAVAGSLMGIADYVHSLIGDANKDAFLEVLDQVIYDNKHAESLLDILYSSGLELDFQIFVSLVTAGLEDWLKNEGADAEPGLTESVSKMVENFGADLLGFQRWMLNLLYLGAVTRALDKLPLRLRKVGSVDEAVLDIENQASWMDYAKHLEGIGETEGASHIRTVCQERSAP